MGIEQKIIQNAQFAVKEAFQLEFPLEKIQLEKTNKDFQGDYTIVVFPFVKAARQSPEKTGEIIGELLLKKLPEVESFNVVKGFLNLLLKKEYFLEWFQKAQQNENFGYKPIDNSLKNLVVEYSSPNTNKPLHLGHIRNNLLGWSVAEILKANGYPVKKVNLVNDRGIHICKSMVAWLRFGNGETPQEAGLKGDHLVGKYYVLFDAAYKSEIKELVDQAMSQDEAEKKAPIFLQAQEMLRKWEAGDAQVLALWQKMNQWVYDGFECTYAKMGIDFDKIYYESQTYLLGKVIVNKALQEGVLFQKEDGSVWADLSDEGLDQKLLLRADGTSVYMTQDLGTAQERQKDFEAEKLIYVVGNEQNYHFDVLKRILLKMGYAWAEKVTHLSYGMVELPEGKMKSREGTVVDADELMENMEETARQTTTDLGKIAHFSEKEANTLFHQLAMGALKYFILKVDPVKNMLFNPNESIDFNGNTGPFIQYTHARICSLLRKSETVDILNFDRIAIKDEFTPKEKEVLKLLADFPKAVHQAGLELSPAIIANYTYELAKEFNGFYQESPILKEENQELRNFRLDLCRFTAQVLSKGLHLLGIAAPSRM